VYRRYAGLFFCFCVDIEDNELALLESIHFFVKTLDGYFGGGVCEIDLLYNFQKVSGVSFYKRAEMLLDNLSGGGEWGVLRDQLFIPRIACYVDDLSSVIIS
tara:strand:+ start:738 stop:1043 length:306 start_codon:yes stop_codon:yes gene_type:complete